MAKRITRTIDPERTRFEHFKKVEEEMQIMANEMGAMTPGELGQYTRGWAGGMKKKKKINTHLQQNFNYDNVEMNYNHNHDERGRFASGEGGGGGTSAGGGSAATEILTATEKNGGGTFQFKDGKPVALKNGFMVADQPKLGKIIEKDVTVKDIQQYMDKHAKNLDKKHALGTWLDKDSGKTYLDVSHIFPLNQEKEAIAAATKANQIAIGKLVNGKYTEIKIGGTGEIPT